MMNHSSNLFTGRLWLIYSGVFKFDLLFSQVVFFILHLAQGVIAFGAIMRERICSLSSFLCIVTPSLATLPFTFVEPYTRTGLWRWEGMSMAFQADIGRVVVSLASLFFVRIRQSSSRKCHGPCLGTTQPNGVGHACGLWQCSESDQAYLWDEERRR
ncbi:hypothetical protein BDW68DRAFT_42616 [Aspergillus falconensis]